MFCGPRAVNEKKAMKFRKSGFQRVALGIILSLQGRGFPEKSADLTQSCRMSGQLMEDISHDGKIHVRVVRAELNPAKTTFCTDSDFQMQVCGYRIR
jgi:hypothetical protein